MAARGGQYSHNKEDSNLDSPRILVTGDSHTMFWSGKDTLNAPVSVFAGVDLLWLGPATAHNIASPTSSIRASQRIIEHMDENIGRYKCVILSFGEIDCRVHILKAAIRQRTGIAAAVSATVQRYFDFWRFFSEKYEISTLFWGPIPTSTPTKIPFHPDLPTFGSSLERNYATFIFNKFLSKLSEDSKKTTNLNLFDRLIGDNFITKGEFLYDGCHLSNVAMEMAEETLRRALDKFELSDVLGPALKRRWTVSDQPILVNIAAGRPYFLSSILDGHLALPFGSEPDGQIRFHTNIEDSPSILFDLESGYLIFQVVIHNRTDNFQERARFLAVDVSLDGINFTNIYAPPESISFGCGYECLKIEVNYSEPVRYLKIYLRSRDYFHLECVEIIAYRFDIPETI